MYRRTNYKTSFVLRHATRLVSGKKKRKCIKFWYPGASGATDTAGGGAGTWNGSLSECLADDRDALAGLRCGVSGDNGMNEYGCRNVL